MLDDLRHKAYEERTLRERDMRFNPSPFYDSRIPGPGSAIEELSYQEHRLDRIKVAVQEAATFQSCREGGSEGWMRNRMLLNLSMYVLGLKATDEKTEMVPVEMVYQPPTPLPGWFEEHMPTFFRWFGGQTACVKPTAVILKSTATVKVTIDATKMFPTFMTREVNDRDASYQYNHGVKFVSCR